MSSIFSIEQVIKMAEMMEKNGARFYRAAADNTPDLWTRVVLRKLADMEDAHQRIFAIMREDLSGPEREAVAFDPENKIDIYVNALSSLSLFDAKLNELILHAPSAESVLYSAIELEKDSVLFYDRVRELVSPEHGRERIDDIIREERSHVDTLTDELKRLRSGQLAHEAEKEAGREERSKFASL